MTNSELSNWRETCFPRQYPRGPAKRARPMLTHWVPSRTDGPVLAENSPLDCFPGARTPFDRFHLRRRALAVKSARKRFIALRPAPVAAQGDNPNGIVGRPLADCRRSILRIERGTSCRGFRLRLALRAALAGSVRFADAIGRQAPCRNNRTVAAAHVAGDD